MATEILGRAVDDHIGAQLERALIHRRGKGVVHRHQRPVSMRPLRDGANIQHLQCRVGGRLEKHQPRTADQQRIEPLELAAKQQVSPDSQ